MFTGIIKSVGKIRSRQDRGGDVALEIDVGDLDLADVAQGDSISVNGVCLTATRFGRHSFHADVSRETLGRSTLGALRTGSPVNLEPALRVGEPLGGHLVSGHVDGLATVRARRKQARSEVFEFELPAALTAYVVPKGSITVDGISLTVNGVRDAIFDVNIVPHTLQATIIGGYRVGTEVNIEVDQLARYLEKLLVQRGQQHGEGST